MKNVVLLKENKLPNLSGKKANRFIIFFKHTHAVLILRPERGSVSATCWPWCPAASATWTERAS